MEDNIEQYDWGLNYENKLFRLITGEKPETVVKPYESILGLYDYRRVEMKRIRKNPIEVDDQSVVGESMRKSWDR